MKDTNFQYHQHMTPLQFIILSFSPMGLSKTIVFCIIQTATDITLHQIHDIANWERNTDKIKTQPETHTYIIHIELQLQLFFGDITINQTNRNQSSDKNHHNILRTWNNPN